jgi:hypothetical protein
MSHDQTPKPGDRPNPDTPVGLKPACPNCGRGPAVVFPALAGGQAAGKPKLVCLLCCPKRTADS